MVYKVRTSFSENRFRFIRYGIEAMAFLLILKLFSLQVWHHSDYEELALQNHNFNKKIFAHRGTIFFRDARTGEKSVAAIDKDYYTLSANPSQITFDRVNDLGEQLVKILNITDSGERTALFEKLSQHGSVYTVLAKKVPEETKIRLEELIASTKDQFKERFKKNTKEGVGIYLRSEPYRFYPEKELAAAVLGFGKKEDGKPIVGQYGIEGYWDQILTGTTGLIKGEKSNGGSWITLAGRTVVPAQNGADIILTIDRALQYRACGELKKMFDKIQSKDASLIVMNPKTGAILVMCSYPDFDPNEFQKVSSTEQFNNISIFTPYDPGSVFKPITMSMALDLGKVTPETPVTGSEYLCNFPIPGTQGIPNAEKKCYTPAHGFSRITMTDVLIYSINTGMVRVAQQVGAESFKDYLEKFGLVDAGGNETKTGITLDIERKGFLKNVTKAKSKNVDLYYASFGQGITVTPLQLAMIYGAFANGGTLMRPYIVDSIQYDQNSVQKTEPQIITSEAVSNQTSALITGMLVATAKSKGYNNVRVDLYKDKVAAKTGTAQIIKDGRLLSITNHTVTGFAPAQDPQVVIVVKFGEVDQKKGGSAYAEGDAGRVFQSVMKMALAYFNIPESIH